MQGDELNEQLDAWLAAVEPTEDPYPIKGSKAVIAPYALPFFSTYTMHVLMALVLKPCWILLFRPSSGLGVQEH